MIEKLSKSEMRWAIFAFAGLSLTVLINLVGFQERRRINRIETASLPRAAALGIGGADTAGGLETGDSATPRTSGDATESLNAPAVGTRVTVEPPVVVAEPAMSQTEIIRAIQRELNTRGYATGQPDGMLGLVTRAAIMAYEHDSGLMLTAEPREELLSRIILSQAAPAAPRPVNAEVGSVEAASIVRLVEQSLVQRGFKAVRVDGKIDAELGGAIRAFETDQKLPVTGRISAPLVSRLVRLQGQAAPAAANSATPAPIAKPVLGGAAPAKTPVAGRAAASARNGNVQR
ncbi:MAG: peptidoglycan-binding domain-containing protein [Hyphomicrobium sp.]